MSGYPKPATYADYLALLAASERCQINGKQRVCAAISEYEQKYLDCLRDRFVAAREEMEDIKDCMKCKMFPTKHDEFWGEFLEFMERFEEIKDEFPQKEGE